MKKGGNFVAKRHVRKFKFYETFITLVALLALSLTAFHVQPALAQMKDTGNMECYMEIAKTMVHGTAAGLGDVLKSQKHEKDSIDLIRKFITPIRFYPDKSGYFYVYNYNCVNIAHATQKDLQGKNLYDYRDAKGNQVIRMLSAASKKGGGIVEYYWIKPGSKGELRKMGYVEPIPGTDYFIGTGIYLP
jgi:signal transduction histidine kinase